MGSIDKQRNGSFRIRWTNEHGARVSGGAFTKLKDAERVLREKERTSEEIRLGLRPPIELNRTFGELADYWTKHKAPLKRSRDDDESIIRAHLRLAFGATRLKDISVEMIDQFKTARSKLSPKTVANILTLFKSMLRLAVKLKWLAAVPDFDKPRIALFSHDYRYLRNDDEVARFLRAAVAEGALVFTLYAVAIYTGMRAGELAGLNWSDVDFARNLIRVERSYDSTTTKSGRIRWVPILAPLVPILREWKLKHPGVVVFTGESGQRLGKSARVFQEVLHRVLERAGFASEKHGKRVVHYITFHGLRHTFASAWVAKGGDVFKLQRILGHQSIMLTMRYAHLAPSAFAAEHELLGASAPSLGDARVLKLRTRKCKLDAATKPPLVEVHGAKGRDEMMGQKRGNKAVQEGPDDRPKENEEEAIAG